MMNGEALTILLERWKDDGVRPTSEQLRLLATVQEQLTSTMVDLLNIAADRIEAEEEEEDAVE